MINPLGLTQPTPMTGPHPLNVAPGLSGTTLSQFGSETSYHPSIITFCSVLPAEYTHSPRHTVLLHFLPTRLAPRLLHNEYSTLHKKPEYWHNRHSHQGDIRLEHKKTEFELSGCKSRTTYPCISVSLKLRPRIII